MPILLGVDTGGTFTDAVLVDEASGAVLAKAKAPTTHDDLALGVGNSIDAVLSLAGLEAADVSLVSLSTTLATNALVEDKGRRACLVLVGFGSDALERSGLAAALSDDELILADGGHGSHGDEVAALDLETIAAAVEEVAPRVDAFAVTSQFSVRNPTHEEAIRELIVSTTGLPVTCSHELSDALNGPKRGLTALLNARLIALVDELLSAAKAMLSARGFTAPLMVVRGDGSLVSADFVASRPIETILSGPAASLIGAGQLSGAYDAVIADIGGTTTDLAVLRAGQPLLSPNGAVVGGHETMVEAVLMHTYGLGGDSEVRVPTDAAGPELSLGPRRVAPVSRLALAERELINETLQRQLNEAVPKEFDGIFISRTSRVVRDGLIGKAESQLIDDLGNRLHPADRKLPTRRAVRALRRLCSLGLVRTASFTPTDAAHVLGHQDGLDADAAHLTAELFARKRDRFGQPIAANGKEVSQLVFDTLIRKSAEAVLATAMAHHGLPAGSEQSPLTRWALDGTEGAIRVDVGLALPIIGLGAPARTYYPPVAVLVGTDSEIPVDADVANAIGATAGRVRISASVLVSAPRRGVFNVHADGEPRTVFDLDEAKEMAKNAGEAAARVAAAEAGARDIEVTMEWSEKTAVVDDRPYFVEGTAIASASGRPKLR